MFRRNKLDLIVTLLEFDVAITETASDVLCSTPGSKKLMSSKVQLVTETEPAMGAEMTEAKVLTETTVTCSNENEPPSMDRSGLLTRGLSWQLVIVSPNNDTEVGVITKVPSSQRLISTVASWCSKGGHSVHEVIRSDGSVE